MAYVADSYDDEEDKNGTSGDQIAGGGNQVISSGPSSGSAAPAQAAGPTKSNSYQNLDDYLTANQGSSFGTDFAGKVQSDVAKGADAQNQASGAFKNSVDKSTVYNNQDLTNQALANPSSFVSDQGNVDQFAKQRDATYGGPNSFADSSDLYQNAYGATKQGSDTAKAAQSEGGRFALLDNYFGTPQYNQGQKGLDNLLVQNNDAAQQGIAQARQNADQSMQNFNQTNQSLNNYATQGRGTTEATKNATRSALGIDSAGNYQAGQGALGTSVNDINKTATDRKTQADSLLSGYQQSLKQPQGLSSLTPDQLSLLGLSQDDLVAPTYEAPQFMGSNNRNTITEMPTINTNGGFLGASPGSYLSEAAINPGTAASADQAARQRALEQLAGVQNPLIAGLDNSGNLNDSNLVNFDKSGFIDKYNNQAGQLSSSVQNFANQLQGQVKAGQLTAQQAHNSLNERISALVGTYNGLG